MAHEIGHLLYRPHPSKEGTISGSCDEAGGLFESFPYYYPLGNGNRDMATIGPLDLSDPAREMWGFDTYASYQSNGKNAVVDPRKHFELMSYCGGYDDVFNWISDYTYKLIRDAINARFGSIVRSVSSAQPTKLVLVKGFVNQSDGSATLLPMLRLDALQLPANPLPGDYHLVLRDLGGGVLSDTPFAPATPVPQAGVTATPSDVAASYFVLTVPDEPDLARVEIVRDGQILAHRQRSASAPAVRVRFPDGGEVFGEEPIVVRWEAEDPDGDTLTYTVQYSSDGGTTWQTVAVDLPAQQVELHAGLLRGTQVGLVRVRASDGFFEVRDESDAPFIVTNKGPEVSLLAPGDGTTYLGSQRVFMRASGIDVEDGGIDPALVTWESDRAGVIGHGLEGDIDASTLLEGRHVISVTAVDRNGNSTRRSALISVFRRSPPTGNIAPVSEIAGLAVVRVGSLTVLDGTASRDPDNSPLPIIYRWRQTSGPRAALNSADSPTASFTPVVSGLYEFALGVNDGLESNEARISILVPLLGDIDQDGDVDNVDLNLIRAALSEPPTSPNDLRDLNGDRQINDLDVAQVRKLCGTTCNQPPFAATGPSQTFEATSPAGASVTLNGSASSDPDGDSLTFTWTGPFGSATGPTPTVTLPLGVTVITLTVSDGKGGTATATVTITVVDTIAPVVTYTGNAGTYTVDQAVSITCAATDIGSGVASTTCQNVSGPAYSFPSWNQHILSDRNRRGRQCWNRIDDVCREGDDTEPHYADQALRYQNFGQANARRRTPTGGGGRGPRRSQAKGEADRALHWRVEGGDGQGDHRRERSDTYKAGASPVRLAGMR